MKTFSNLLAGIDFSDSAHSAFRQARRIADSEHAKLTALHVIIPSEVEDFSRYFTISSEALRQAFLGEVRDELEPSGDTVYEAVFGLPYEALTQWSEMHSCDLLVIGSQGVDAHPHGVGIFASKCARRSNIPVLIVTRRHETAFKKIVACVDFSDETPAVLKLAAQVAIDEAAELHVLHAVTPPWLHPTHVLYNTQTFEDNAYKAQFRELLRDQMEAACDPLPIKAKQHTIETEHVGAALVKVLNELEADLAVVGRSGHTGKMIKDRLLGTTAERLIHRSPCSVLVVPPASIS